MYNTLNAESDINLGCFTAVQYCFLWQQQQGSQNLFCKWWHSHPCSGIHWPFKVTRNCSAGISGLELWFRENNRCTILEALKVLVANLHRSLFTAVPVALGRNWKWLQQAACFEMLHAIRENMILIVATIIKNSSVNQHLLVLKLKEARRCFHKFCCHTSQKNQLIMAHVSHLYGFSFSKELHFDFCIFSVKTSIFIPSKQSYGIF